MSLHIPFDLDRKSRIASLDYDYAAQSKEWIDHCNLCGSAYFGTICQEDRYGYPASAAVCQTCGLTFLNPRMTATAYTQFYQSVYRPLVSAYHGRLIDAQTVQKDQVGYTDQLVKMLAPFVSHNPHHTLLDVGGSTGVVAAGLAKAYGWKATVIDPAPDEVEAARAMGIESITGFVEDWDPKGKSFDFVGIFQTIDHLLDIKGTFSKLRTVIKPEGLLLVDIVDFRHAYLRSWSVQAGVKIDHPYYLTESSTRAILARTGFDPIYQYVSPDMLHVLYICKPMEAKEDFLPPREEVNRYLEEIRYVQGTAWMKSQA